MILLFSIANLWTSRIRFIIDLTNAWTNRHGGICIHIPQRLVYPRRVSGHILLFLFLFLHGTGVSSIRSSIRLIAYIQTPIIEPNGLYTRMRSMGLNRPCSGFECSSSHTHTQLHGRRLQNIEPAGFKRTGQESEGVFDWKGRKGRKDGKDGRKWKAQRRVGIWNPKTAFDLFIWFSFWIRFVGGLKIGPGRYNHHHHRCHCL